MTRENYVCTAPPIESLLEETAGTEYWPESVVNQTNFQQQILSQRDLLRLLKEVYGSLPPKTTLAEGLSAGLMIEKLVQDISNALATQLEHDAAQQRLAIYLPLEFLSPIETGSRDVVLASARLKWAFRAAWEQQLLQHEVRANYVDGDVLEFKLRTGDLPRVVKAAHLIPGLLQVGHLTVAEVLQYQASATDPVLGSSLCDACTVAADLGVFPRELIISYPRHEYEQVAPTVITENRARWLARVEATKLLSAKAAACATNLIQGDVLPESQNPSEIVLALEAIRLATPQNPAVLARHKDWITKIATNKMTSEVRDSLVKLGSHLYAQNFASKADLEAWGVTIPDLGGACFSNVHRLQPTRDTILETCRTISLHPDLAQLVYPVALIFGSQIKGYGRTEADCDVAVFVAPGVDRKKQAYLQNQLAAIFSDKHFDRTVKLFWLEETGRQLRVIDWPEQAHSDGESSWLHTLFGALWFGEESAIKLLHERLLVPYFTAPHRMLAGKPVYERWVEEMERDSLQYRLMHNGFECFYPIQSPLETRNAGLIDGHAAFYDSNYRRIATELFVRRVWLPQV